MILAIPVRKINHPFQLLLRSRARSGNQGFQRLGHSGATRLQLLHHRLQSTSWRCMGSDKKRKVGCAWRFRLVSRLAHAWRDENGLKGNPPGFILPTFLTGTTNPPIFALGTSNTFPFGFQYPALPPESLDGHGGLTGASSLSVALIPTYPARLSIPMWRARSTSCPGVW